MKKMILAATAALAMLASCNKHTDEIADSATGSVVKITLTDKTPETRAFFDQTAAAESWEKKIGTLTLFVFDGNGDAVLQRNFTAAEISGQTATIPVPDAAPGQTYSFYAIANGSALSGIGTLDDLRSQAESEIADYNGTFDEVTTMLHEFGHALHGIFAAGTYPSLTGTAVYRDFVELPSQIMENWAYEKEFLDLFAVDYRTGEKMPAELIRRILDAKNYLAAYSHIRQVAYGLCDMAWHSISEPVKMPVVDFEKKAIARAQVLPYVDGQCTSTSFGHIFSGGYAAGYYSYKWAEVLEADAFSLFKEKGIFDRETAASFRENILSKGGSEHPMKLYVRFRGHKPDTQALFDKMGIE